jgi:uncharacterized membrane protein YsdA (DUF1294 family)
MIQIAILIIAIGCGITLCANGDLQQLAPVYLLGINVATFLLYGWDKMAAMNDWWRIMEFTLHTLSFLGGWPAAFVAQHLFNHKTRKFGFQVIFWLIVVIHVVFIGLLTKRV